jgi:hypothetical protein
VVVKENFHIATDLFSCQLGVMRTHADIIRDAGGYKGLAAQISLPARRVMFWQRRDAIPARSWVLLVEKRIATLAELAQRDR